jgi:SepF-like predicted cell division protein (DUF552 family)
MNTTLRLAPHYFVIDSIGGMNEGYSDTTCRRIEDVVASEYAKAMVEEYIDQWVHDRLEYYTECIATETERTEVDLVRYDIEECPRGGWVRLTPKFSDSIDPTDTDDWGFHTLFIQVYDGIMLGDGVVVYDQMDDMVTTITHKHTAIRMAEETISIDVERIKRQIYTGDGILSADLKYYTDNLTYAYDCLADVVRSLEYPQDVMVDIDDTCTHYFPVQAMKQMVYTNDNRITTL